MGLWTPEPPYLRHCELCDLCNSSVTDITADRFETCLVPYH